MLLIVAGSCSATLDLSNLNLRDFQFFRYQQSLPNGELKTVKPPPPSFGSHIQRAKAGETVNRVHCILTSRLLIFIWLVFFFFFKFTVGTFVQHLLFGYSGNDAKDIPMVFPPTVEHLRERFERRYGYRGKYLIEQLGNGYFRYSSGYTPCSSCKF